MSKKYQEPTLSALYRAKNPLAQYPEFQQLRSAVAGLQRDSLEALRLEEESQVTVKYLARQLKLAHRGLHMLTDIMVDELSAMKMSLTEKDTEINLLQNRLAQVEKRQAEYSTWSQTAREDLVDIRRAVEREMNSESQELRRLLSKHARTLEDLGAKVGALQAARESTLQLQQDCMRAARDEATHAARRAVSKASTATAESLDLTSKRLGNRIEQLNARYDKLESHVLDLVDLLKTRALQEEALEGRSVYTGAESVLRRDSSIRGSLF